MIGDIGCNGRGTRARDAFRISRGSYRNGTIFNIEPHANEAITSGTTIAPSCNTYFGTTSSTTLGFSIISLLTVMSICIPCPVGSSFSTVTISCFSCIIEHLVAITSTTTAKSIFSATISFGTMIRIIAIRVTSRTATTGTNTSPHGATCKSRNIFFYQVGAISLRISTIASTEMESTCTASCATLCSSNVVISRNTFSTVCFENHTSIVVSFHIGISTISEISVFIKRPF